MPEHDPTRRAKSSSVVVEPDDLRDVPLAVGDGDGYTAVLEESRDRLVFGTSRAWNVVIAAWVITGAASIFASFVFPILATLAGSGPPRVAGSCFALFSLAGLYFARGFRNRHAIDAERGEVTRATTFGLVRRRIALDKVAQVVVRPVTDYEGPHRRYRLDEGPEVLAVALVGRKGGRLLILDGPRVDRREAAFHLLLAARIADLAEAPLRLEDRPEAASKSLTRLWNALAEGGPDAIDDWRDRHPPAGRPTGLFRPNVLLGVLALLVVTAAAQGVVNQSLAVAAMVLSPMMLAASMLGGGWYAFNTRHQGWLKPASTNLLHNMLFKDNPQGYQALVGVMLMVAGGVMLLGSLTMAGRSTKPLAGGGGWDKGKGGPVARADERKPFLEYKLVPRADGTREVRVNSRNMNGVEVGIELLTKPEPEVREKALGELAFHVDRKHPRRAEVLAALAPFLKSDRAEVRRKAVDALGNWGTPETLAVLEPMLADPDQGVRDMAKRKMGDIRDRQKRGEP